MNRQSLEFIRGLPSLSPNSANSPGNLSHAATTLAHAKLKAASDDAHRISVPALA